VQQQHHPLIAAQTFGHASFPCHGLQGSHYMIESKRGMEVLQQHMFFFFVMILILVQGLPSFFIAQYGDKVLEELN
jgi:hypothetical protein